MRGYDLTFLTYELPNVGEFEWEVCLNFGMSKRSEKIETFISENLRSSWFFLTILTYKIFELNFFLNEMKKFLKIGIYSWNFPNFLVVSENFRQILVQVRKLKKLRHL